MKINANKIINESIALNEIIWIQIEDLALLFHGHQRILTPIGWRSIGWLLTGYSKTILQIYEIHDGNRSNLRVIVPTWKIGQTTLTTKPSQMN